MSSSAPSRHVERAFDILGIEEWKLVSVDVERNQRVTGATAETTLVLKGRQWQ
jgi:hypothetical protein